MTCQLSLTMPMKFSYDIKSVERDDHANSPKRKMPTEQVAAHLIAEISPGTFPVGTKLSTGEVLAETYDVVRL